MLPPAQRSFEEAQKLRQPLAEKMPRIGECLRLLVFIVKTVRNGMMGMLNFHHEIGDGELQLMRPEALAFIVGCQADWASPADLKREISSASILKDGRVVFNVAGNKYRIVAWINYPYRVVYVRFIGTHAEYDRIDAQTV